MMPPVASSRRSSFWQRWRSWRRRTGCASSRTGPPPTARRGFDVKRDWDGCHLESWRVGQVLSLLLHVLVLHALHVQLLLAPVTKKFNWKFSMNWTHSAFHVNTGSYRHRKINMICLHFATFDLCTIRKGDEKVCYWGVWPVYHHWSQLLPKFCITRNIRRSPSRGARSRFFLRILRASSFWAGLVGCEVGSHLCKWT